MEPKALSSRIKEKKSLKVFFSRHIRHQCVKMLTNTDYRRPIEPFFIEIPKFWAWADNLGR